MAFKIGQTSGGAATGGGGGAVASVNGKTGAVSLVASDVGAAAVGHTHAYSALTGLPTLGSAAALAAGGANGAALLDGAGKLPNASLPALHALTKYPVASQAAMLALAAVQGDLAIRTDTGQAFFLTTSDPTTLANWTELSTPLDSVQTVNGKQGPTVSLVPGDIGAATAASVATNTTNIATNTTALASKVDVGVQSLTTGQKTQARANLGLAAVAASGAYADLIGAPSGSGGGGAVDVTTGLILDYAFGEGAGVRLTNVARPANVALDGLVMAPEGQFSNSNFWSGASGATDRYALDPLGGSNASRYVFGTGSYSLQSVPVVNGQQYTASLYVQSNTGAAQTICLYSAQNGWSAALAVPATGWTRVSYTFTAAATNAAMSVGFGSSGAGVSGDQLIFGFKINKGPTALPYERDIGGLRFVGSPTWAGEYVDFSGGLNYALGAVPATLLDRAVIYVVSRWPVATAPVDPTYSGLFTSNFTGSQLYLAASTNGQAGCPAACFNSLTINANATSLRYGGWGTLWMTYDSATLRMYLDDAEIASATGANITAALNVLQIASLNYGFAFAGQIAALRVYAGVSHTPAKATAVRTFLAARMAAKGLTLPVARTTFLQLDGDSIMAAGWPAAMAVNNEGTASVPGRSWAVTGSGVSNLVSRAASLDALVTSRAKNLLVVHIGRNDLVNATTAQNGIDFVTNTLKPYVVARRAAGHKVYVGTILPSTVSAGFNVARNAANTQIKSDSSWYDGVIDFGADPTMGPDAAAANTAIYVDGTHPTAAGTTNLANIAWSVLQNVV